MKKKFLTGLLVVIGLVISATYAYAMDIDGWWAARTNLIQGDFQTGEWTTLLGYGKRLSYMYMVDANENSYGGPAWLFLWDDLSSSYIKEIYPIIYVKNNIILLFGPTFQDADGNFVGNTILLRPYGTLGHPYMLRGYYTVYDTENVGTTDQFVRMGTLDMTRIEPRYVPKEVKDLQLEPLN